MAEQVVKRVVAVDVIHRMERGKRQVIEPRTILDGKLPRKEIEELLARGAARIESVLVEVREAPTPKAQDNGRKGDGKKGDGKGDSSEGAGAGAEEKK